VRPFPNDVLDAARTASFELFDEVASADSDFQAVYVEWVAYRQSVQAWFGLGELAMLEQGAEAGGGGGGSGGG
jgi:TRAP-type mannitol/chloroaromatic compound transport system substrate-binding protein